jgi:predicted membrane-bound mannosyltransferase
MNTVSGIFALILGGLISSSLMLLKYSKVFNLDLEVVLTPFIVITILTYGDKILIFLFLSPMSFASKLINKERSSSKSQQQLTLKQS